MRPERFSPAPWSFLVYSFTILVTLFENEKAHSIRTRHWGLLYGLWWHRERAVESVFHRGERGSAGPCFLDLNSLITEYSQPFPLRGILLLPFSFRVSSFFQLKILSLQFSQAIKEEQPPPLPPPKLSCCGLQTLGIVSEMEAHVIRAETLALCFWIDCC